MMEDFPRVYSGVENLNVARRLGCPGTLTEAALLRNLAVMYLPDTGWSLVEIDPNNQPGGSLIP